MPESPSWAVMFRRRKPAPSFEERWLMRNGSVAVISKRAGRIGVGNIEGTDAIHTWVDGKSMAGRGYDFETFLGKKVQPDA